MKKMTKQTEHIVDRANMYLKVNKVTSEGNDIFLFVTGCLIQLEIYHGFNWVTEDEKYGFEKCVKEEEAIANGGYLKIYK